MRDHMPLIAALPPDQQAIRAKCVHPTGTFIPFEPAAIEQSIPDRFEQQVASYPDRLAVKTRSHALTYAALNHAANGVAHALLTQHGPGSEPIALLLEKDAPLIATILGVLKAGKIYVPLDPFSPPRLRSILEDLQARLIVTENRHLHLANELAPKMLQVLNSDEIDASRGQENPELSLSAATLAYILYTSGSTGQPKGVVQNHRNVLHKVMRYTNDVHLSMDDRISLLPSCSFEAAVRDVFGALLNGATLFPFILKDEGLTPLANFLTQEEITIYHSTPTVFRHFIATLTGQEAFPMLRLIYLGGEPVSKQDMELYRAHFAPHCIFVNEFGSTEHGTGCQYFIDKEGQLIGSVVPVGYAVEGVEILVLDETGHMVGVNGIGEIALRSRYLSPGYWRKPELTQAAFQPDPRGGGERIYRTGDLGRLLPDGCLEHLGRKDFQVKIRGHRIEVAEIELALCDLAAVQEAVVVAREEKPGDMRLVAYIVPAQQPPPTPRELRGVVQERLPDYMVPSAFVFLEALPLTPTGKVDRLALPPPSMARPDMATPFAAPRTPMEDTLTRIWTEVLGLTAVGIHDPFLELGGDSLMAMQIVSRVRDTFHVEMPLRALLEASTIADMTGVIIQHQARQIKQEDLARLLAEVEALSEEEVTRRLTDEGA
jgi:amino acid adenylation domain-containing protein